MSITVLSSSPLNVKPVPDGFPSRGAPMTGRLGPPSRQMTRRVRPAALWPTEVAQHERSLTLTAV
jgi:hypothetical protein